MNIIYIPDEWGVKRVPRTSPEEQKEMHTLGNSFESMYDYNTLFVDAIKFSNGDAILVGPPLYELKNQFYFTDGKEKLKSTSYEIDRCCITVVKDIGDLDKIFIENSKKSIEVELSKQSDIFNGKRLIGTIQKDEPVSWIIQWVKYYNTVHGVDGFVIYNNMCETYTAVELKSQLCIAFPHLTFEVLEYECPLGAFSKRWDSNFAQIVMYAHIKYKYAWCADLFLNHDIDELLVMYDDITLDNVYSQLVNANVPGLIYGCQNIDPYNERLGVDAADLCPEDIKYSDYYYWGNHINNPNIYGHMSFAKWFIIPNRLMNEQWLPHHISGNHGCKYVEKDPRVINVAHFHAFRSPNKKNHPIQVNRSSAKDGDLIKDDYLEALLKETFLS